MSKKTIINKLIKDTRGFTLSEILVVMFIIGILAAIIFSFFPGRQEKANASKEVINLDAIAFKLDDYVRQSPNKDFSNFNISILNQLAPDFNITTNESQKFGTYQLKQCSIDTTIVANENPSNTDNCRAIITCENNYFSDGKLCLETSVIPLGIENNITRVRILYKDDQVLDYDLTQWPEIPEAN